MRRKWEKDDWICKKLHNIEKFNVDIIQYPVRHPNHVNISTLFPHLEGGEEINSFLGKIIDDAICTERKKEMTHESELLSRPANSAMLRTNLGNWQKRKTATITRRIREKLCSVANLFLTTFHSKNVPPCGFRSYLSMIEGGARLLCCATTGLLVVFLVLPI